MVSSSAFVEWGYAGSSKRGFVKVVHIPYGYKTRALAAVKCTPRCAASGGYSSSDIAAALAGVGLHEVELSHTRRYTIVDWQVL